MGPFVVKAEGTGVAPDFAEVLRAAAILFAPETCHELRGLPSGRSRLVRAGDEAGIRRAVADLASDRGVYYTLNPVRPDLGDHGAKNADVLRRRWLLIDCDPVKASKDDSATDVEKGSACLLCSAVEIDLTGRAWPEPITIDSGNGYHLLYRIDLPNDVDTRKLLAAVLKQLAAAHDTTRATVDRKVHNAARISKLPGTWARKGVESAERPYRLARLLMVPDRIGIVSAEQIRAVAGIEAEPVLAGPSPFKLKATNSEDSAYARSALEREVGKVAVANEGRNNQLYESALKLAGLVAGGSLDEAEVRRQLTIAAERAGLGQDGDPREIVRAIDNAFVVGKETPKQVPEPTTGKQNKRPIPDAGELIIIRGSEVKTRPVHWLWPGYIPLGKLTTFAGWGGLGKSFTTADLAARVSTGEETPLGGGECFDPASVVILNVEDDPEDTTVPRLIESDADLDRVTFLKEKWLGQFLLSDLDMLTKAIEQTRGVKLIIVDPATAYLGGLDDNKNARLRSILSPLGLLARHYNLAVVLVTHVSKTTGGDQKVSAAAKVIGSVAWVNTVRSAFMFMKDPESPDRKLFLNLKINNGPPPPGLAYRIMPTTKLAKIDWIERVDTSADDAIQVADVPRGGDPERAAVWLAEFLAGGAKPSKECVERGNAAMGISRGLDWWRDRIYKGLIKGKPLHQGYGTTAVWVWELPPSPAVHDVRVYDAPFD